MQTPAGNSAGNYTADAQHFVALLRDAGCIP